MKSLDWLFFKNSWLSLAIFSGIGIYFVGHSKPGDPPEAQLIAMACLIAGPLVAMAQGMSSGLYNYLTWTSASPMQQIRRTLRLSLWLLLIDYVVMLGAVLTFDLPLALSPWDFLFFSAALIFLALSLSASGVVPGSSFLNVKAWQSSLFWLIAFPVVGAVVVGLWIYLRPLAYISALVFLWALMLYSMGSRALLYPPQQRKMLLWGWAVIVFLFGLSIPIENHRGNLSYVGIFKTPTWDFDEIESVKNIEDLYAWHSRRDRPMEVAEMQKFAEVLQNLCPPSLSESAVVIPCHANRLEGRFTMWEPNRDAINPLQANELLMSPNYYARLTAIVALRAWVQMGKSVPLESKIQLESLASVATEPLAQTAQITLRVISGQWPSHYSTAWALDLY